MTIDKGACAEYAQLCVIVQVQILISHRAHSGSCFKKEL